MTPFLEKYASLAEQAIARSEGGITIPPLHLKLLISEVFQAYEQGRLDMRADINDCNRQRRKDLVQS